MPATARGALRVSTPPNTEDARREVNACLAELWPLLLAVSEAADGPDPRAAAGPLRSAARRLVATADGLE
jgi:hypothetical protein